MDEIKVAKTWKKEGGIKLRKERKKKKKKWRPVSEPTMHCARTLEITSS